MTNREPIFPDKNKGCGRDIGRLLLVSAFALLICGMCLGVIIWQYLNETSVIIEPSPTDYIIFNDGLSENWVDNSFNDTWANIIYEDQHSGQASLRADYGGIWGGLQLTTTGESIDTSEYQAISFWVKLPWQNPPKLDVALIGEKIESPKVSIRVNRGAWQQVIIPITDFDSPKLIKGVLFQNLSGEVGQHLVIDDIRFLRNRGNIVDAPTQFYSVNIDMGASKRPISPHIYGLNFADLDLSAELSIPVNRWGGNATTRYNWKTDVSNRASDWFFENIPNPVEDESTLPYSAASNQFIADNNAIGTDSIMTIPLIGWTPKARARDCSFPVDVYPNQQHTEDNAGRPCGNGVYPNGDSITGNDPLLSSTPIDQTFVRDWIYHLTGQFGTADNGGLRFYSLDNEPMLWHITHRDVHPELTSYDELLEDTLTYATTIKAADPSAQTLGPVVWGWLAYFYSAKDLTNGKIRNPRDREAHGDVPLLPWYLQQMAQYEREQGVRLLDYLDIHYYPPFETNVALAPAGNRKTQSLRMRSTRSLWDASYVDESWIDEEVMLIPRMRSWIDSYYPGTKLAITEYNFGALDHINGAIVQADTLGIFGREGVDLATLWDPEKNDDPWAFAFRMFRNYDGQGGQFGDMSVPVYSPDPDKLSVYVAERTADNILTVMVINKSWNPQQVTLNFNNGRFNGDVSGYEYGHSDWENIKPKTTVFSRENQLKEVFPPQSITLLEIQQ